MDKEALIKFSYLETFPTSFLYPRERVKRRYGWNVLFMKPYTIYIRRKKQTGKMRGQVYIWVLVNPPPPTSYLLLLEMLNIAFSLFFLQYFAEFITWQSLLMLFSFFNFQDNLPQKCLVMWIFSSKQLVMQNWLSPHTHSTSHLLPLCDKNAISYL